MGESHVSPPPSSISIVSWDNDWLVGKPPPRPRPLTLTLHVLQMVCLLPWSWVCLVPSREGVKRIHIPLLGVRLPSLSWFLVYEFSSSFTQKVVLLYLMDLMAADWFFTRIHAEFCVFFLHYQTAYCPIISIVEFVVVVATSTYGQIFPR